MSTQHRSTQAVVPSCTKEPITTLCCGHGRRAPCRTWRKGSFASYAPNSTLAAAFEWKNCRTASSETLASVATRLHKSTQEARSSFEPPIPWLHRECRPDMSAAFPRSGHLKQSSAWMVLCLPASENLHMSRSCMGLANPVNLAWRTARRRRYAYRRATICSVKLRDSSSTAMMVPDLRVTAKSIPAK